MRRIAFYGLAAYNANPATYNATVKICTPLTTDDDGNIFFGFMTESGAPGGLVGGFARIGADGRLARVHPHDPSWQAWLALEHAVMNDIVPDFPLINKSFNLSYSGADL